MSDWIEHDGKKYFHQGYLQAANINVARRNEEIKLLRAQLAEREQALERLRAALEPFAAYDATLAAMQSEERGHIITVGDFRRAAEVLRETPEKTESENA